MIKGIKLYYQHDDQQSSQQLQSSVTPAKEKIFQSTQRMSKICQQEQQIFNLIHDENLEELEQLKITRQNLNFLEQFQLLPIDSKITPLVLACYKGNFEIVKLLLQNEDIDPNLGTQDNQFTPLMITCMSGQYEIASMLINQGANVNLQNEQGQTPLLFCFSRLEENTNHFENKRICMKMATLLFENGADLDRIVNLRKNYTILMVFCATKYPLSKREGEISLTMIKFLLQHGASPHIKSHKDKNCFVLAQKHSLKEKVLQLLDTTHQIYFYNNNKENIGGEQQLVKDKKCKMEKEEEEDGKCEIFGWVKNFFNKI